MKKTLQINIGGRLFHIDEDAYLKLQQYLDNLKKHFEKSGEEGKEIIDDIEQRIAELLENRISQSQQVITLSDIEFVIQTLGEIEDFNISEQEIFDTTQYERKSNRKFYRDCDNNYFGGVAAGLGAYFDINPLWTRIAFIVLLFLNGIGILIYGILWIVVPKAVTTAQKLHMKGIPVTINTIQESIQDEYQKIKTNFNQWGRSEKTRNVIDNAFRAFTAIILAFFKLIIYLFGIVFLITGSLLLALIIAVFIAQFNLFGIHANWFNWQIPNITGWISNYMNYQLLAISLFVLIFIPIVSLIYAGIKIIFNIGTKSVVLRATTLTAWILALILFVTLLLYEASNLSVKTLPSQHESFETKDYSEIIIGITNNLPNERVSTFSLFDYSIISSEDRDALFRKAQLSILPAEESEEVSIRVIRHYRFFSYYNHKNYPYDINYQYVINDSSIILNKYFKMDEEDFWKFGNVDIELKIPENRKIKFQGDICDMIILSQKEKYCKEDILSRESWIMTNDGLKATGETENRE